MKTILLVVGIILCQTVVAEDAMFRGNLQHSGVYNSDAVSAFNRVKWKFRTGGAVMSSPAVIGGTVYIGSTDHHLYALDAATGEQKWKFKTQSRVNSSPAASNGVVFFGSYDGNF